jgi:hypothetical protein
MSNTFITLISRVFIAGSTVRYISSGRCVDCSKTRRQPPKPKPKIARVTATAAVAPFHSEGGDNQ